LSPHALSWQFLFS